MFGWLRRRRREALRRRPFPAEWLAIVQRNVPYLAGLSPADQAELLGHAQVLLAEKHFEGCGGLVLTDEVRVTIAAQAAVLLLHRDPRYYPKLFSILVYPSTYVVPAGEYTRDGLVAADRQVRLGESSPRGTLVLAWDSVLSGAVDVHDGQNLVLHEFAHQLDQENGGGNGTPVLGKASRYAAWGRVLSLEFEHLAHDLAAQHSTVIDAYGATNPAEFFAVVTEAFFEKPAQLRQHHPALYDELRRFYQQDPAAPAE